MAPLSSLASIVSPERLLTRPFELAAYACDASFYTLTPRAVVRPIDTGEVKALFAWSAREGVPLTFRAAGTSLSGQAVGSGVLVDVSRHWRALAIEEGGRRVRVGPGVVAGHVNARLAPFGAKLGPDPASINACMIGGIVANNSSGMCCGIEQNAYRTLAALRFVLPSGLEIDTAAPGAAAALEAGAPGIARGLMEIKRRLEARSDLVARIRYKYSMKNTIGYSLNAFLDFATPLEILWHLLVGSEGTLAFVAEATFDTVPDRPAKATGLLFFDDVPRACEAILPLKDAGARALEIMDRASMRSVEGRPGVPDLFGGLPEKGSAILVEYQADDDGALSGMEETHRLLAGRLPLLRATELSRAPARQAELWSARRGLTATIGAMRPSGTSMIFEDVTFPLPHLAAGVVDLQGLFAKHGYDDGIVFGHAKDGNIHFLLSQGFRSDAEVARYGRFTEDLVEMVVSRYDGALKAEHGTGRNMAPFVEREWGTELYGIMREIKALIDPRGILNPGVLLNDDPRAHLTHLKSLPTVEETIDRCIECGFCERYCPSRDLTLTPRQRIVLRREQARLAERGDHVALAALADGLDHALLDTCATDGMCAVACPVEIDTGAFVKAVRGTRHGAFARALATAAASRFAAVERAARAALSLPRPGRLRDLPGPADPLPAAGLTAGAEAVYVPSCLTRIMAPVDGGPSVAATLLTLCARAGVPIGVPGDVAGTCCGMPFSSKGFEGAYALAANRAVERLDRWSDGGRLPVVVDASPCAWSLSVCRTALDAANRVRFERLHVLDAVAFAHDVLLPRLAIARRVGRVAVHPVCSLVKSGLAAKLEGLARACAAEATVPVSAGCCGFAGDRGFVLPELTAAATRPEAAELAAAGEHDRYVASSATCEIGMTRATGRPYVSILRLLEEATRPGGYTPTA